MFPVNRLHTSPKSGSDSGSSGSRGGRYTSINAPCRITGIAKNTVLKLFKELGCAAKLENHGHMVALYFMHYNFCRIHKTLRVTPAMEAGITDHVWSFEELLALLETDSLNKVA